MDGFVPAAAGRIGPNAVTRLAEALGEGRAAAVFGAAGLAGRLAEPPGRMVPEAEVIALHRAARALLGEAEAAAAAREAGVLTARYLLAHRIPAPMQRLLRLLPARLAAALLFRAIGRHAWTFAGSGRFRVLPGRPLRFAIEGGPIARAGAADHPVCGYYAATFETLFRALVQPRAQVVETACEAMGAPECAFTVTWPVGDRAERR
jgi:divinyl protochlorophyllide a 8-vinyl-reductase